MKIDKFMVGKRYGKALFELAAEKQETDPVYQDLLELRKIYQLMPDVGNILSDARLELDKKRKIMDIFVQNFDGLVHNFLEIVFEYRRMDDLLLMIEEYERRYDQLNGLVLGTVVTAVPLSDEKRKQIEEKIASLLGYKKAELSPMIDPEIIGGVVVEAEHKVIDGSIAAKLEEVKNLLGN